jgi:hypothetical protein
MTGRRRYSVLDRFEEDLVELSLEADESVNASRTVMGLLALVVFIAAIGAMTYFALHDVSRAVRLIVRAGLAAVPILLAVRLPLVRAILEESFRRPGKSSIIERQSYSLNAPVKVVVPGETVGGDRAKLVG